MSNILLIFVLHLKPKDMACKKKGKCKVKK